MGVQALVMKKTFGQTPVEVWQTHRTSQVMHIMTLVATTSNTVSLSLCLHRQSLVDTYSDTESQ